MKRRWPTLFTPIAALAVVLAIALLASDRRSRVLGLNTLGLASGVALASATLGLPLAFLLARTDVWGRRLACVLLGGLLFTPLYLQAAAWQGALGAQGWLTLTLGLPPLVDGWRGTIIIHTAASVGWVVLIVAAGLLSLEPELEEYASLEIPPREVFWRVTLRRSREFVAAAMLWVMVLVAGEMTVTDLFGIRTFAEQLYTEFALGDSLGAAPWRLLPSLAALAIALAAGLWLAVRLAPHDRATSHRRPFVFALGRWRAAASLSVLVVVGLLCGVLIASLAAKAGLVVRRVDGSLVRSWSSRQALSMVAGSPARFSREFEWSLLCGLLAASLAVIVSTPLAWLARGGGRRAAPAALVIAVLLAMPGPLVGLAIIALFASTDWPWLTWLYDRSIAPIVLAQTLRATPIVLLVVWHALAAVPRQHLETAALEGCGFWEQLFRVALPQRRWALLAAWCVALAVCWGEISASLLVAPPGITTLPIAIFNLIHYGVDDRVAGVSLFLLFAFFLLGAIVVLMTRRAWAENH